MRRYAGDAIQLFSNETRLLNVESNVYNHDSILSFSLGGRTWRAEMKNKPYREIAIHHEAF